MSLVPLQQTCFIFTRNPCSEVAFLYWTSHRLVRFTKYPKITCRSRLCSQNRHKQIDTEWLCCLCLRQPNRVIGLAWPIIFHSTHPHTHGKSYANARSKPHTQTNTQYFAPHRIRHSAWEPTIIVGSLNFLQITIESPGGPRTSIQTHTQGSQANRRKQSRRLGRNRVRHRPPRRRRTGNLAIRNRSIAF